MAFTHILVCCLISCSILIGSGKPAVDVAGAGHMTAFQPPPPPPTANAPQPLATPQQRRPRDDNWLYVDDHLGYAFEYPGDWSPLQIDEQGIALATAADGIRLRIIQIEGLVSNVARYINMNYRPAERPTTEVVDAHMLTRFSYNDGAVGEGIAFYLERAQAGIIIVVELPAEQAGSMADDRLARALDAIIASLTFTQPDSESPRILGMPTRLFSSSEYEFEIRYPLVWDVLMYDVDADWFVSLGYTNQEALYIYPIDENSTAEAVALAVIDAYDMDLIGEIEPRIFQGYDAVEFTLSYKYNGTWYGRALALVKDETGLVFSVEMLADEEEAIALYEEIIATLTLED